MQDLLNEIWSDQEVSMKEGVELPRAEEPEAKTEVREKMGKTSMCKYLWEQSYEMEKHRRPCLR